MSNKMHFKFSIGGSLAVCVEDGSGYGAPTLFDTVGLSIRTIGEKGKLGKREAVTHFVHRHEIASIGMAFLDVAKQMTPETIWGRSETVYSSAQQHQVLPLSVQERNGREDYITKMGPALLSDPASSFEKLRKRMPTLQRMQYLLERVDDTQAQQLEMLLTIMEHVGTLPFSIAVGAVLPNAEVAPSGVVH